MGPVIPIRFLALSPQFRVHLKVYSISVEMYREFQAPT